MVKYLQYVYIIRLFLLRRGTQGVFAATALFPLIVCGAALLIDEPRVAVKDNAPTQLCALCPCTGVFSLHASFIILKTLAMHPRTTTVWS